MGVPLIQLPPFIVAVFIMYWSLPILAMSGRLKFWQFRERRNDMYEWGRALKDIFRVRILKFGSNPLYKAGPAIFLCNHRSWADFFVDVYLVEGAAALMSRWLVFAVFPVFMSGVYVLKGVVVFKRGAVADKEKFNTWLDSMLKASLVPGLLVYPEGHRSIHPTSLTLKRGMVHYAHSRGFPVQIIITRNKESVLSEKTKRASWGATLVTGFSEVMYTKDTEFEAFWRKLQATWDKLWADVYAADASVLPVLTQTAVPTYDFTQEERKQFAGICVLSILLLLGFLVVADRVLMALTGFAGVLVQKALLCALVSWLVAAFTLAAHGEQSAVAAAAPAAR